MNKIEQSKQNLKKAIDSLERALSTPPTEERDYAGIIQNFEFVYELTWKTLKLILESRNIEAPFPRVVFEEAFKQGLLEGNEIWADIIEERNLSSHTYDLKLAKKLYRAIHTRYFNIFKKTYLKIAAAL